MDYKNKHKEEIIRATQLWECGDITRENLEYIFPELAESDDEKIRKELIKFVKVNIPDEERYIAWLEKQGEQKPNPYTGTSFEYNGHIWGMCARDNGVEILFDGELKAFLSLEKSFIYPIHPQPTLVTKSALEAIKEEKVDNADKVEPKFHKGEWIVHHGTENIYKVIAIVGNQYQLKYGDNYTIQKCADVDRCARLWDITKDAKDGDVLACESGWTCIFKTLVNDETFSSYCFMDDTKWFCETGSDCHTLKEEFVKAYNGKIHPATKEQRDLLFKKMKDAGYEWDVNKKELKKFHVIDEGKAEMDYCFTKMMNGEKVSSAWSEEDAFRTSALTDVVKSGGSIRPELRNEFVVWLKSLKDRVQPQNMWKPNKEQIIALRWILNNIPYNKHKEEISGLLDQIKDLKL